MTTTVIDAGAGATPAIDPKLTAAPGQVPAVPTADGGTPAGGAGGAGGADPTATGADPAKTLAADTDPGKTSAAPATWPADWREKLAGSDSALMNEMKRFSSPDALAKAFKDLKGKISSGNYKSQLPTDATPEQTAAWRKENGIPESPDGYDMTLDNGLIIGEAEKPLVAEFLKEMHGVNADQKSVRAALNAYKKLEAQNLEALYTSDRAQQDKARDILKADWGQEYTPNINLQKSVIGQFFPEIADLLRAGRMADGTVIGDHSGFLKGMAAIGRELNPAGAIMPGTGDPMPGIADRMKALESKMGTRAYTPEDHTEYARLVEVIQKVQARAA